MDFYDSNKTYKIIYYELNNNIIINKAIYLTFTKENNIYPDEKYNGYDCYECLDNYGDRFIFYIDSINHEYCFFNSEADPNDGKINCFSTIKNIYLDDKLIFIN
jgi:hypothetical protein